jgi:predicted transcriptional regulator
VSDRDQQEMSRLTVDLLSAYFQSNSVPSDQLAELIDTTRTALAGLPAADGRDVPAKPVPAVSIEESTASRDHIVSLIDGKSYKSLKRHLANNGLTPQQYRERYALPADYPLVAPAYSEHRSAVAKSIGLGGKAKASAKTTVSDTAQAVTEAPAPATEPKDSAPAKRAATPSIKRAPAKPRATKQKVEAAAEKDATVLTGGEEAAKRKVAQPSKATPKGRTKRGSAKAVSAAAAPETATSAAPAAPAAEPAPKRRTLKIRTGGDKSGAVKTEA